LETPTSSPQMMTMLGFCGCWAAAGAHIAVAAASTANEPSKIFLVLLIACIPPDNVSNAE
jgi:hypothetical protein